MMHPWRRCPVLNLEIEMEMRYPTTLNEAQQREVGRVLAYMPHLGKDYAARALSALYRSAMRASQQRTIEALARELGVTDQRDWVI